MTETKAERSPQAEAIANYYEGQVRNLNGSVEWHIQNIQSHIAHGVTPSSLRAIIAEATGALQMASKAETLEEVLKHL
jgi:hypothetical protein